MKNSFEELKAHLREVHNLEMAGAVLDWDQQTYMPSGGAEARAETRATLSKVAHDALVSSRTAQLLERAENENRNDSENDEFPRAAFLRVARRDFERATKLPSELVEETARVTALAQGAWQEARERREYSQFAPWLEKVLELSRRTAQALGGGDCLYDALLDTYEEGMTRAQLDPIFVELKGAAVPLLQEIVASTRAGAGREIDESVLSRGYDTTQQLQFSEKVLRACGYDFSRGRQDLSAHPFCTNFSQGDVRITTRVRENDLQSALFGSLHEMGHALYEQNIAPQLEGTPLGGGVSLGVHESQSRLWENLVGRSRDFWSHWFAPLCETFPAIGDVSQNDFYRAINAVKPSLIRTEADEVTYNLHVVLRYEIENELLENRLSVADAPAAWNARMSDYFGIEPSHDGDGILQDVHWSLGAIGYFPTYSLGNIWSVQLWDAAIKAHPDIPAQIARGEYSQLLNWLRENVHRFGRTFPPAELMQRATGETLNVAPYAKYLREKYAPLYGLK